MKNRRRAEEYANKAREEFNQKFGYRDSDDNEIDLSGTGGGYSPFRAMGSRFRRGTDIDTQIYDGEYRSPMMYGNCSTKETPKEFFGNDDIANKYLDAQREADAYNNDEYEYGDDGSWHLKNESVNRIVRESIRKALRNL